MHIILRLDITMEYISITTTQETMPSAIQQKGDAYPFLH